jgi:hypothetical protein
VSLPPIDGSIPQPPMKRTTPFDTFERLRLPRTGITLEGADITAYADGVATVDWNGQVIEDVPVVGGDVEVGDRALMMNQGSTLVVLGKGGGAGSVGPGIGYVWGGTIRFPTPGSFSFRPADYPGLTAIEVELVAGGGAGGGAPASTAGNVSAGGGGGGGGYSRKFILLAELAATETVIVGANGVGVSGGDGTAGGSSSFGSHLDASGGGGGVSVAAAATTAARTMLAGAGGGLGHNGHINGRGGRGGDFFQTTGGSLGGTPWGGFSYFGAGANHSLETNGSNADTPGGGGGGMRNNGAVGAKIGGAGGPGLVLVRLYYGGPSVAVPSEGGYRQGLPVQFAPGSYSFLKGNYPGAVAFRVQLLGGGGGGGGAAVTAANQWSAGSGGEGGGYSESVVLASDLAASAALVVGAGGLGITNAAGEAGGPSSLVCISRTLLAIGGAGAGAGAALANTLFIGVVGAATTIPGSVGDSIAYGGSGGTSVQRILNGGYGGYGGSSRFSGERRATTTGNVDGGTIPAGPGGGGAGGQNNQSQAATRAGGPGGPGLAIITPLYA